jgi:predicted nuclease of predicted toxin-antitoxin system
VLQPWECQARDNDFIIVSKDADMHDLSLVFGNPSKVIEISEKTPLIYCGDEFAAYPNLPKFKTYWYTRLHLAREKNRREITNLFLPSRMLGKSRFGRYVSHRGTAQESSEFNSEEDVNWLRLGNCSTSDVEKLLHQDLDIIRVFYEDRDVSPSCFAIRM